MPGNVFLVNGKKFLWDGVDYPSREQALEKMKKYQQEGFEAELREQNAKTRLYTRRTVKNMVNGNP